MKILVTGAKGFVGKNLVAELRNRGYEDIFECDIDTTKEELDEFTKLIKWYGENIICKFKNKCKIIGGIVL